MRQKTGFNKNNKVQKGAGRIRYERQDDGRKKKTTIQPKGKSGTIYRGENRCTTWKQVYDMRH